MANPLSSETVLKHMADALPTHLKGESGSDMSSSYEAIALFAHASMIAVGFRLLGFHEEDNSKAQIEELTPRLPPSWNSGFGTYSFLYAHTQSQMKYVLKIIKMGGKAEIKGIGLGDERITGFEITAKDYVSGAALPLRIGIAENGEEDRTSLQDKLKELFISPSRIQDLAAEIKHNIIQKLIPGLNKEGYEEEAARVGSSAARAERQEEDNSRRYPAPNPLGQPAPEPARPHPYNNPLADPPRRPLPDGGFEPPGFDDEYDLNRPLRGMAPSHPSARSPFGIGSSDLNPPGLGPRDPFDPLRPGAFGGGGNGGMHPTFDDPLFQGQGGGNNPFNSQAPPGARFDPPFPGQGPPQGRGGLGGSQNPFNRYGDGDFL